MNKFSAATVLIRGLPFFTWLAAFVTTVAIAMLVADYHHWFRTTSEPWFFRTLIFWLAGLGWSVLCASLHGLFKVCYTSSINYRHTERTYERSLHRILAQRAAPRASNAATRHG